MAAYHLEDIVPRIMKTRSCVINEVREVSVVNLDAVNMFTTLINTVQLYNNMTEAVVILGIK
jgi:hypothetical protein